MEPSNTRYNPQFGLQTGHPPQGRAQGHIVIVPGNIQPVGHGEGVKKKIVAKAPQNPGVPLSLRGRGGQMAVVPQPQQQGSSVPLAGRGEGKLTKLTKK